eukprot:TRINITY_DN1705_c0_g1_i1.p1 TRINITY_DN1705_c0_g1~~TRINITY_DN1705_c0_g1_i1.p1  ORF type:complete len:330 (-),score=75.48 TRINITY_DN1705_c0_g1_i1:248-1213(-)
MNASRKKKVLLMGTHGAGKTSMRAIIFANYIANDTMRLGPTQQIENHQVRFLGNLNLSLWDCGGQDRFTANYFTTQRDQIFSNVEVLVYVMDVTRKDDPKDRAEYEKTVSALREYSPEAKIFLLLHKMDLVREDEQRAVYEDLSFSLKELTLPLKMTAFATSIWDETLYKAWSTIVYSMIPNAPAIESNLDKFGKITEADEVVLFEKATFLVIAHSGLQKTRDLLSIVGKNSEPSSAITSDPHRFEKISNIIKQFKLSCSKAQASFKSMHVTTSRFTAFIDEFTSNTYILLVQSVRNIQPAATMVNIKSARAVFESLLTSS